MVRRLSALTRRCGCGHYMFVNCAPAKCFCLPDIGRHRRLCARGNGRGNGGAMRNCCPCARLALRFWRGAYPRFTPGIAFLSRCCPRFTPGFAVLSRRFVLARGWPCGSGGALILGSRPALRSCRGAFPRFTPAVCLATNRTACDMLRSYSAGSRSPFARSRGVSAVICLCWFTSGLAVSLWRSRRGTKRRGERGDGERSRRRIVSALLREHIGFAMFSAGSPLGAARPQTCAKESSTLWTLFTLRRGWGGADSLRRHPGTIGDLTGSNLWPGRSCGRTIAPTRSNVQTRAARRQRRGVGFQRAERSGSGTAASLDSLHAAAGLGWCVFAAPSPGQVVWPHDRPNTLERPDSKRPQALKSRVACAKRCGSGHCPPAARYRLLPPSTYRLCPVM